MNIRILLAFLLCYSVSGLAAESERWFSADQVARGEKLFLEHCAACHGKNAEATPNWKQTDANGNYPPPPLDGSAHAWHHDLEILRRTIRQGGKPLGGLMPAFEGKLDAAEIDAVIAFFQSKWPDEIYQRWAGRFGTSELPSLSDIAVAANEPTTRLLRQRLGADVRLDDVAETDIYDVFQVKVGPRYIYLLGEGRYALMGDLVDLEAGVNLTERARRATTLAGIAEFADADLVVFPAKGERKATLHVFTDTSCPYCQKLHEEIEQLQQAGISVRYLPYPRGGSRGPGYATLKSVWCADDRPQAMTDAKQQILDDLPAGDCTAAAIVDRGFTVGNRIGITGTPALFLDSGEKIEGYRPHTELIPYVLR